MTTLITDKDTICMPEIIIYICKLTDLRKGSCVNAEREGSRAIPGM